MVKFRNYLDWNKDAPLTNRTQTALHTWLIKQLPYIVYISYKNHIDLKDVGEFVNCKWSAYLSDNYEDEGSVYLFEEETEAVAFKLKFF